LNAQFLAIVNIIVYAGAIMVLFLFVIMFLNLHEGMEISKPLWVRVVGIIAGGSLFLVLLAALKQSAVSIPDSTVSDSQIGMVKNLGVVLFSDYLLPFELASILLLVAMVGAVLLARREEGEKNTF
jgi:NADH-quinone oxidoreductase subunit J